MNLFGIRGSSIAKPADFQNMYDRHRLSVLRYIYGLIGGPQEDAEDLTAETFLRAWKARHRFEGDAESAIGWLLRIARRLVIDGYRRSRREAPGLPPDLQTDSTPEQITMSQEQKRLLFSLLKDLTDEQREILSLRYMLGWRVGAIARYLGATENNVSVMIHRTLSRLREKWIEQDGADMSVLMAMEENVS